MISKMTECISKNDIRGALIIGQNLLSKNPGDKDVFSGLYSVLCSLITATDNVEKRQRYFQQLSALLSTFSEAVDLDDSMIEYIKAKEDSLNLLFEDIENLKKQQKKEYVKEKVLHNDSCLKEVCSIIEKLKVVTTKQEFDTLLQQLQQVDSNIAKDFLIDRQKKQYESKTQECSQVVDKNVRKFEREKNVDYNIRALEAYEKAFKYFKEAKDIDNHKEVIKGFFEFDVNRLFNETLTYYNHVYSYILSKLNDDEKFTLTKAAIHCKTRG